MGNQQSGFTLIELIVVVVILGILAAVAVPRFIDLSDEAEQAAIDATANSMGSAMALNYAACAVSENTTKCKAVTHCEHVYELLTPAVKPDNYTVTPSWIGVATSGKGETEVCTVVSDRNTSLTAEFNGIRTDG